MNTERQMKKYFRAKLQGIPLPDMPLNMQGQSPLKSQSPRPRPLQDYVKNTLLNVAFHMALTVILVMGIFHMGVETQFSEQINIFADKIELKSTVDGMAIKLAENLKYSREH